MNRSPDAMAEHVATCAAALVSAVRDANTHDAFRGMSDDNLVATMTAVGDALRACEGALIVSLGEAADRSTSGEVPERLTTRFGCASVAELAERATRVASGTARSWLRVAQAIAEPIAMSSGERMPAALPSLRAGILAGEIGSDSAAIIHSALLPKNRALDPDLRLIADEALAAVARGSDGPAAAADIVKIHARQWAAVIDPDGTAPTEAAALRHRGLTLGRLKDGLVDVNGRLLPEVAEQLTKIWDAAGTPRHTVPTFQPTEPPACDCEDATDCRCAAAEVRDPRTAEQKRHDAFATALFIAAGSAKMPTLGGAAPTLVVMADESALTSDEGTAFLPSIGEYVPIAAGIHAGCAGVVQRVSMRGGRITHIGSEQRIFNHHQRRAIALRDGGCVIPDCTTPAAWCEVHHVTEWAEGGATHTDNGVLLCWFHHRYLDQSGWNIRMIGGIPEVRAPSWIDPRSRWRRHPITPLGRAHRHRLARATQHRNPPTSGTSAVRRT